MKRVENARLFLRELMDVSAQQVVARDLPAIIRYVAAHPEGGWSEYEGEGDGSAFKVHDVEFVEAGDGFPDRYRIVFKVLDERTGDWSFAREDFVELIDEQEK